ncbi:MAG: ABC transporter ATP-binding protein [Bacteroidota bacterium]
MIITDTIKQLKQILPSQFKKQGIISVILLFINSILELVGLASLLPLFMVILKENVVYENQYLNSIYNTLGYTSENAFIISIAGLVVLMIILKNIVGLLIQKYQTTYSYSIMEYFMIKLHKYYYKKGFLYFKETNSNIINRDIFGVPQRFAQSVVLGMFNLFNEVILLMLIVIAIVLYNPGILLLLVVTIVPVFVIFYKATKDKIAKLGEDFNKVSPEIGKSIFQSVFGYVDVIINGTYNFFQKRMTGNMAEFKRISVSRTIFNLVPTKLIETTMVLAIFAIITYGLLFMPSKESLAALLGVYAVAAYRIMPSINRIMIALNGLNESQYTLPVIEQVKDFEEEEVESVQSISFNKAISLENISFKYPNAGRNVIDNFNLRIKKGEVIGLRGQSGGGKTTLMNIVLGFLDPTSGELKVDGKVINNGSVAAWQKKLGYVQQEVYLLDASLAENIAFGIDVDKIDYDKVDKVIEQSSLSNLTGELEQGVNTRVGERGAQLSGGQRQRVGIARALYFDAEVLFFDEATSALDPQTEIEINESIKKLSHQGLTMMIIAHRETSLNNVDRIIEM